MTDGADKAGPADRARPFEGIDTFSIEEDGARWSLVLDPDEPVFAGHYPGNPILPGVYTLESVQQGVERLYAVSGARATLGTVKSLRFLAPFVPGDRMTILVTADPGASGETQVSATVLRNGDRAAAARLCFMVERSAPC